MDATLRMGERGTGERATGFALAEAGPAFEAEVSILDPVGHETFRSAESTAAEQVDRPPLAFPAPTF